LFFGGKIKEEVHDRRQAMIKELFYKDWDETVRFVEQEQRTTDLLFALHLERSNILNPKKEKEKDKEKN